MPTAGRRWSRNVHRTGVIEIRLCRLGRDASSSAWSCALPVSRKPRSSTAADARSIDTGQTVFVGNRAAHLGFRPGQFSLGGALLADVQQPGRIPLAGSLVTSWDYLCDYDDGIGQGAFAARTMGRLCAD